MDSQIILDFWFVESTPEQWFKKDNQFDQRIRERFEAVHQQVIQGEKASWRETIQGRLAEILVLDQFSRNLFRGDPRSFAYDGMALVLAQEAIAKKELNELTVEERSFVYMPFMHSESLVIHQQALELFSEPGMENNLDFEKRHYEIIKRFGRYPHRNAILNRSSTQEELMFLKEPNSSF
ncbi:DUF924 family protein [Enterococcus pallens]|uniref:DUF924 domain-containing protein n=1 Tax=Enterococcus pallens ATCC BAA-351 TaxID=1158607 RepID=R2SMA8_9ENTE|nr:DUF924 family protein [Enterococcus pallens]EOH96290.1 hypothetical protein UAU_00940 [Enterococcus pallens ATCC BAA-351]EOU14497.1 hypothetical protein I588_04854 [Enterococcus pallens ATCC BAA-351]OJG81012.1 hypothetical protein RV10_GL004011 [Enterococcus pallens]